MFAARHPKVEQQIADAKTAQDIDDLLKELSRTSSTVCADTRARWVNAALAKKQALQTGTIEIARPSRKDLKRLRKELAIRHKIHLHVPAQPPRVINP